MHKDRFTLLVILVMYFTLSLLIVAIANRIAEVTYNHRVSEVFGCLIKYDAPDSVQTALDNCYDE